MRRAPLKLAVCLLLTAAIAQSQPPAPDLNVTTSISTDIHLGDSVVPLYGPWKFTIGDSPVDKATGKLLWADPNFNDSQWETVDLTPKHGSVDPVSGLSGYVAGWTARGHAGYWGYAWYRIRVKVQSKPGIELALLGPADVDDAYQAFNDGVLIGSFGTFRSSRPIVYYSQPMMFPIEESSAESVGGATKVLAFRFWMEPNTLIGSTASGGIHSAPQLGEASAVAARNQVHWDELIRAYSPAVVLAAFFTLLGCVALSLRLFDKTDPVYFWIGALLLVLALRGYLVAIGTWTQTIPALVLVVIDDVFLFPISFTGWVIVWRVWFRLRKPVWVPRVLPLLVVLQMISGGIGHNVFFTVVSQPVAHVFGQIDLTVRVALVLMILGSVIQGIVEHGIEGWLALPAVLFASVATFRNELALLNVQSNLLVFGIQVTLVEVSNLLLVAALAILLLRRLLVSVRTQREMALDVKQAQEVQQVILPESHTSVRGLVVESEYRPAREVGGDFFQVLPNAADGSLLIVAGDVAGKGLKAGMLVALLVGAIRSTAELNPDPEIMLQALNRRLIGRGDAQATCLAVRIEADGSARLVNAGHVPPYLNGEPIGMEGALPLGAVERPEFSETRFRLNQHDRLMLMSDGIVEATNVDGNLFGFERLHQLVQTAATAAEVASAAQGFGQEDDISVISVTRTEVLAPALV